LRAAQRYAKSRPMPTNPTPVDKRETEMSRGEPSKKRPLSLAAERALAEVAARRAKREQKPPARQSTEVDGRDGPEPTRYGDWEVNGLASDF